MSPFKHSSLDSRSLLERWMAAKPWENRLKEDRHFDSPDMTPLSRKSENHVLLPKARRNAMTTRISSKPLTKRSQSTPSSFLSPSSSSLSLSSTSAISSECMYDDSPLSASSTSPDNNSKPSLAKKKTCRCSNSVNGDARSTSGSEPLVNFWRDVYGTPQRTNYQRSQNVKRDRI